MAGRAHKQHITAEQILSDALFGVGVKAMDDLSTDPLTHWMVYFFLIHELLIKST